MFNRHQLSTATTRPPCLTTGCRRQYWIAVTVSCLLSAVGAADAALVLTQSGINRGFTLSTVVYNVPVNYNGTEAGIGAYGAIPRGDGRVLATTYSGYTGVLPYDPPVVPPPGPIDARSLTPTFNHGIGNSVGLAFYNGRYFMARQNLDDIVEVDPNGRPIRSVGVIPHPTNVQAYPDSGPVAELRGKLFISQAGGGTLNYVYIMDPANGSLSEFVRDAAEGLAISCDGRSLLMAAGPGVRVYPIAFPLTPDMSPTYSISVPNGAAGVAVGRGALDGFVYSGNTRGQLYEIELATGGVTLIAQDTAYPNNRLTSMNPDGVVRSAANDTTLLVADSREIYRLTRQAGGGWCDGTGVPCNQSGDCNTNGIADQCEIAGGAPDCNQNGLPDVCDLRTRLSNAEPAVLGFVDISATGTPQNLIDDQVVPVTLPFTNAVFPNPAGQLSNNGAIGFGGTAVFPFTNARIPSTVAFGGAHVLFPYWDDLFPSDVGGNVYVQTIGTAPNRTWIVMWDRVRHFQPVTGQITFEVQVFETPINGVIAQYLYADTSFDGGLSDDGGSATIGYQLSGTVGSEWSFNLPGAVTAGTILSVFQTGNDCNTNGIPDDCDLVGRDCNTNGILDSCEIGDCNTNDRPDECDIAQKSSGDCNTNETPDECELNQNRVVNNLAAVRGFIDISPAGTGSGVAQNLTDDQVVSLTLPFTNAHFSNPAGRLSNNGGIGFGGTATFPITNTQIPSATAFGGAQVLFPYWDDLFPSDVGGNVYVSTEGVAPNRTLVVMWDRIRHYSAPPGQITFEVQIFETPVNGIIAQFLYADTTFDGGVSDDGGSASIGYQRSGTNGAQWSHNVRGAVTAGSVVSVVTADQDGSGIPDVCDPGQRDCNTNGVVDTDDLLNGNGSDCNTNGILDVCDIRDGEWDCNTNALIDVCEIASGAPDCNTNDIPDQCELRTSGVILNQPPDLLTSVTAGYPFRGGFSNFESSIPAENFRVFAPTTLRTIRLWGAYSPGDTPFAADLFTVSIHAANGAVPADTPLANVSIVAVGRAATGRVLPGGLREFEFTLTLVPLSLPPGDYFVAIANFGAGDDIFLWESGAPDSANGLPGSALYRRHMHELHTPWRSSPLSLAIEINGDSRGNDCDTNGVPDECDTAGGMNDANTNGVPDECELVDCNTNNTADASELAGGFGTDCDTNMMLDECDIAAGAADCNSNDVLDICETGIRGPIHWWRGDLNALDSVGSAHGTPTGITYVPGVSGQAFMFSGGSSINFGPGITSFRQRPFTIAFWLQTMSPAMQAVMNSRSICNHQNMFDIRMARFMLTELDQDTLATNYASFGGGIAVNNGVYRHITITRSGRTTRLYVDCVLDASVMTAKPTDLNHSWPFVAGIDVCDGVDGTVPFVGALDDIQIYDRALSQPEICDLIAGGLPGGNDCNTNGTPDECDAALAGRDCNTNLIPDECDIHAGAPDCNDNGTPDSCDLAMDALDCNTNSIPDECDTIAGRHDLNTNGIPDECEFDDCNTNGTDDALDLTNGGRDCNTNGTPDECDVAGGSEDCNANGLPDACEMNAFISGALIIGGDDADDHGSVGAGGANERGWLYIQQALLFLGNNANNGQATVVCLGCNGGQAQAAFAAGFDQSVLPGRGFTRASITGASAITAFFDGVGSININNVAMVYLPTSGEPSNPGVDGGILDSEIAVVNARAGQLNRFIDEGGSLFTHSQNHENNGYGWLSTIAPGIVIGDAPPPPGDDVTLTLTAEGRAAFPTITDAIMSNATPWHNHFSGSLSGLQVLVRGAGGQNVIIGGIRQRPANRDCNTNGVLDSCDITFGTSLDCDTNGTPDACEAAGDCNSNGTPDVCEAVVDCNTNGTRDACEAGFADCNSNGVADACELSGNDCNTNRTPDDCEPDCNTNAMPDACDIGSGASQDCNTNGEPDECDVAPAEGAMQAANAQNGYYSDPTCSFCGSSGESVAENFIVGGPSSIEGVVITGGYFSGNMAYASDNFTVIIHVDNAGLPGAVIDSQSNLTGIRVNTGVLIFGVDRYEYTIALRPVSLPVAGLYWIEIFNAGAGSDTWTWETGNYDSVHGAPFSAWAPAAPGVAWLDLAADLSMTLQLDNLIDANGNGIPDACESLCACQGDTNGDARLDGGDIAGFVNCLVIGTDCDCTDSDHDGRQANVDRVDDLAAFIAALLGGASCP